MLDPESEHKIASREISQFAGNFGIDTMQFGRRIPSCGYCHRLNQLFAIGIAGRRVEIPILIWLKCSIAIKIDALKRSLEIDLLAETLLRAR